jgi:uncharacterized protein (DUF488 family)
LATLFTIGHSNRTSRELIDVLRDAQVEIVVDVRANPKSGRFPHFDQYSLAQSLGNAGIAYQWAGEALGGLRATPESSPHSALDAKWWGYAEQMGTRDFRDALAVLIEMGNNYRVAVLCAEKQPEDCHRALLSDALLIRGLKVVHLIDVARSETARLNPKARVDGLKIVYDLGSQGDLFG